MFGWGNPWGWGPSFSLSLFLSGFFDRQRENLLNSPNKEWLDPMYTKGYRKALIKRKEKTEAPNWNSLAQCLKPIIHNLGLSNKSQNVYLSIPSGAPDCYKKDLTRFSFNFWSGSFSSSKIWSLCPLHMHQNRQGGDILCTFLLFIHINFHPCNRKDLMHLKIAIIMSCNFLDVILWFITCSTNIASVHHYLSLPLTPYHLPGQKRKKKKKEQKVLNGVPQISLNSPHVRNYKMILLGILPFFSSAHGNFTTLTACRLTTWMC